MKLHGKFFLSLVFTGLIFQLSIINGFSAPRSSRINTLDKIRPADYTDFSRITLEFSQPVKASVSAGKNLISVRLVGVNPGSYKSEEKFDSESFTKISFHTDRSSNVLTLTIPVSPNVDVSRLHSDVWTDLLTIDMPLRIPNNKVIPSDATIDWAKKNGKKVVIIDPGHGGFNTNAQGSNYCKPPYLKESEVALDIAIRLYNQLNKDPRYLPIMTRYGDYLPAPFGVSGNNRQSYQNYALHNRVALAQKYKGDIFVSLHFNAPPKRSLLKTARGFEIYYLGVDSASWLLQNYARKYDSDRIQMMGIDMRNRSQTLTKFNTLPDHNKDLALIATNEVKKSVPQIPLRAKTQKSTTNISVLRHINMPSILAEMGFITHPSDHELFRKSTIRDGYATAFHNALDKFFYANASDLDQLLIALKSEPIPPETQMDEEEQGSIIEMGVDAEDSSDLNELRNQLLTEQQFTKVLAQQINAETGVQQNSDVPAFHIVKKGDSLNSIAEKYATTDKVLKQLNVDIITGRSTIYPGQKLQLPGKDVSGSENAAPPVTETAIAVATEPSSSNPPPPNTVTLPEISPNTNSTAADTPPVYVVKRNDTLEGIAIKYNVKLHDLKYVNNKTNNLIHPGEEIKIPSSAPTVLSHFVKPGETLGKISDQYGVPLLDVKLLNDKNSNTIFPGEEIKIPVPGVNPVQFAEAEAPQFIDYKVRRGDSLWKIQQKFNVPVESIKKANGLRSNNLDPGMSLQIPSP